MTSQTQALLIVNQSEAKTVREHWSVVKKKTVAVSCNFQERSVKIIYYTDLVASDP